MSASQLPLFAVVNTPEMEAAAVAVLRSGQIAGGEYVARFEQGLAGLLGVADLVSTVDMTSAMFLALQLSGVRPGDEVLTTAFACMATNAAIAHCGAVPVWVDLLPGSAEIDVADLARKAGPRTRAAVLYHVAGYPGDMHAAAEVCHARGVLLIEDCDNALLASRGGAGAGSVGDFAVYSFYPNRQINTAEGGALYCRDPALAARARRLRRFGIDGRHFRRADGEIDPACDIAEVGWACTMNNLSAALGCMQLETVAARLAATRRNAAALSAQLHGIEGVRPVPVAAGSAPAYWVLLVLAERRDALMAVMKAQGIQVSTLHCRNDNYSGFRAAAQALPNTDYLQRHVLALPCGWWLTEADVARIADVLRQASLA